MHAPSDTAEAATSPSVQDSSKNTLDVLYHVTLGPVRAPHYLPIFERFDAAGRALTGWNWAASLSTLNWMVFRQLWGAALVYVAAAEVLALLVFGVGRPLLDWPETVERGLLTVAIAMAFMVPGLYGDAILYLDIRKRISRALSTTRSVPDACALLARQAASWKRLVWLVLVNGVLAVAAAGVYFFAPQGSFPGGDKQPHPAAAGTATVAPREVAASAPTEAALPKAPAIQAETTPTFAPPASGPQPQALQKAPLAVGHTPHVPASTPFAPIQTRTHEARADAPPGETTKNPTDSTPAPDVSAGYYINVGLFAEESNARRAQALLLNEGLPAFRQALDTAKGRRIRLRVGPYNTAAAAKTAAPHIRQFGLDAIVFKQ